MRRNVRFLPLPSFPPALLLPHFVCTHSVSCFSGCFTPPPPASTLRYEIERLIAVLGIQHRVMNESCPFSQIQVQYIQRSADWCEGVLTGGGGGGDCRDGRMMTDGGWNGVGQEKWQSVDQSWVSGRQRSQVNVKAVRAAAEAHPLHTGIFKHSWELIGNWVVFVLTRVDRNTLVKVTACQACFWNG